MPDPEGVSLILLPLFYLIGCAAAPEQIAPPLLPFAMVADAGEATATGVAVGGNGDIYLAGDIEGPADFNGDGAADGGRAGEAAVFLARYDAAGRLRWVRTAGGAGNWRGYGVAVDRRGNVYIAGHFEGSADFDGDGTSEVTSAGDTDTFVGRYGSDGALHWIARAGGPGADRVQSIALDSAGNVFVAGGFRESPSFGQQDFPDVVAVGDEDVFVASYSPDGDVRWVRAAGGPGSDTAVGVAADVDGNVFVTGWFEASADFDGDGEPEVASDSLGFSSGYGVAVGSDGSVAVTGALEPGEEYAEFDMFLARFDGRGRLDWVRGIETEWIAAAGGVAGFTARYDRHGGLQWTDQQGGRAVAADALGSVYVTGQRGCDLEQYSGAAERAVNVARFEAGGAPDWYLEAAWVPPVDDTYPGCSGRGVAVARDGTVYVAGWVHGHAGPRGGWHAGSPSREGRRIRARDQAEVTLRNS